MHPRWARAAFISTAGACLGQASFMFARMPPIVASHFVASGAPNAWMPRGFFVGGYAFVVAFMVVSLSASIYGVKRLPIGRINLPHKEYWLAPERRDASLEALEAYLLWFGTATFVLLFDVFLQTFRVSVGLARALEHVNVSLGIYAVFTAAWLAALFRRFADAPAGV
jgi:hypothetical protein